MSAMRGSLVPVVTPFRKGQLDDSRFVDLIEWQIDSGSHGVVVAGTTGEPGALTLEEREHLIELAVRTVRRRVPVVAGTGTTNHAETLRLTQSAKRTAADAALVVLHDYTSATQDGRHRHFRRIS